MQNEISGRKRHCAFRLLMGLLLLCSLLCAPDTGVLAESGEILIPLHVEAGTNLITLAKTYCKRPEDWKTIARINRLSPPYLIHADGEIEVPFCKTYANLIKSIQT